VSHRYGLPRRCALALAAALALGCHKEAPPPASASASTAVRDTTLGLPAADGAAQSAAAFVQAFYQWYGKLGDLYQQAVHDSPAFFAPALLAGLHADSAAKQQHPDEVVGLDWDPFLETQDPCDPYQVMGTTRRGDTVLVAVGGMCSGREPRAAPDVIAEVMARSEGGGTGWIFVDFRHTDDAGSLMQDLKALGTASASGAAGARGKSR